MISKQDVNAILEQVNPRTLTIYDFVSHGKPYIHIEDLLVILNSITVSEETCDWKHYGDGWVSGCKSACLGGHHSPHELGIDKCWYCFNPIRLILEKHTSKEGE